MSESDNVRTATGGRAVAALKRTDGPSLSGSARKKVFLDHLAATCNVRAAARAAGATASYFYNSRRTDPHFGALWQAAVQAGYDRLEEELLAKALGGMDIGADQVEHREVAIELVDGRGRRPVAGGGNGDRDGGGTSARRGAGTSDKVTLVDVQLALNLLNRRDTLARQGRETAKRRRPTGEEVEAKLTAKLDALARRVSILGDERG